MLHRIMTYQISSTTYSLMRLDNIHVLILKTNTLHQAQLNKMDRLSDKLSLKKNDRVLDIGCGWGSLSRYMTENFWMFNKRYLSI